MRRSRLSVYYVTTYEVYVALCYVTSTSTVTLHYVMSLPRHATPLLATQFYLTQSYIALSRVSISRCLSTRAGQPASRTDITPSRVANKGTLTLAKLLDKKTMLQTSNGIPYM